MQLLILLQERARELGITLHFETPFEDIDAFVNDFDLVVAADGINSKVRQHFEHIFKPDIDVRACKFVWLGTHQKFNDAFTFIFEKPSTAGSGRTPTNSMTTPRPSSLNAQKQPGTPSASAQ